MRWLEQRIREYEHARWTTDDNRRVLPFEWGLEHIGGRRDDPDPRGYLNRWVPETIAHSDQWFATTPPESFELVSENGAGTHNLVLTFPSSVHSPWPENNRVVARYFPARTSGAAVVVLSNWNAKWHGQVSLCRWLNTLGITALKLSLPYHDRRRIPGHERADYLVGPNIGLTLQANRQAVTDTRRCLRWLESQGYSRLGLLGISIGASVGSITLAHDAAVRAGAFLHVSRNFGDVVRTGITTAHVWEGLRNNVSETEIAKYWEPISPHPYLERMAGSPQRMFVVTAKYDPSMWPELSEQMIAEMRAAGVEFELLRLPCGHYSLELPPFSWAAGGRLGRFLFENLA
jgi:hypothetical protein